MKIAVCGLWHLGSVTAACLAEAGHQVIGLDADAAVVAGLQHGRPPLHEPGLAELVAAGLSAGRLAFTTSSAEALKDAELLWVAHDTPVNDLDEADVSWVRQSLEAIANDIPAGALVLLSSQVPVGFTAALERDWKGRGLRFACVPENLRLGRALNAFRHQERIIVGLRQHTDRPLLQELLSPFCGRFEWMSVESAEMTKHALNAFLAASVTFINEVARLCETLGADAKEVERGIKSEPRVGPRAYLAPGAAFAGGTLARDLRYLVGFGLERGVATPFCRGVLESNQAHQGWLLDQVERALAGSSNAVAAFLGLTYKAGTSTLRRSPVLELAQALHRRGVRVRAHDPAVTGLPAELAGWLATCADPLEALRGADVAVVAADWPEYRRVAPEQFVQAMRCCQVIDPNHFLAGQLADDSRIRYVATGRAA